MRVWHILHARLRSLFFRDRRESDLREELQFHVEREAERLEAAGMPSDAAHQQALRTFGGVEPVKEACRDTRGTALLDNVVRDVRFAGRSFQRTPLVALTIVTTVGLGLGLVAAVFTMLNVFVFRVDQVHNPYELFAVERERSADAQPEHFTRARYETFVRETGVFSNAFARTPDVDAWIEGRRMEGALATGNVFQVLGVNAAYGRTFTPAADEPGGARVIVISHRAWTQFFDGDPGVLSRPVQVNGTQFHVVGVMPDGFRGLTVAPLDFWAPLSLVGDFRRVDDERDGVADLGIIGRLRPGLSRGQALAQLQAWDANRAAERGADRPVVNLALEPRLGTVPQPLEALVVFSPLFFAFGLVLLIGCANVANLLFARAVARQREIGVRLAIGASRRRIVWQLLTESLLLALVSAAVGFGVSRVVLRVASYALTSTWSQAFGDVRFGVPPADWRVALFLVAGAMASTVFFALAPALQATRIELVRAIRGEVVRDARPGRARDALVALQVTGSALLLICAAIFLRATWEAAAVDPGIRTADTVNVSILAEPRRETILEVMRNEPSVDVVAASWPGGLSGRAALAETSAPKAGLADSVTSRSTITYQRVSPEYFDVLGIDLVRGRGFTQTERDAHAAVAVVSARAARELWPGLDPLEQVLRLEPAATQETDEARSPDSGRAPADVEAPASSEAEGVPGTFLVVGVVEDVAGFRMAGANLGRGGVYIPTSAEAAGTSLVLRVRGDAERARDVLVEQLGMIDPNMSEVFTLQTIARLEAYLLGIPFWLSLVLGALALLLTVSGLFSVLSYLVEQRTKEIGVRMAIGATSRSIGALVLAQSARPVGIGLLIGTSLTAAVGAALLATPAAEQISATVRLFDPIAYAVSLLCIVAACASAALIPARRAGRIDPVGALRQE